MEEEVKNGGSYSQMLVPFLTAFLGFIVFYFVSLKRHYSETLKKEAADKLAKEKAPLPAQPVQVSKKNVASAKLKAIAAEKAHQPRHHLDLVTLKGHGDAVTGIAFTSNGRGLATACADQVVRVFKLEEAFSKSFKFLRLNLPSGNTPTGVAFGEGASQLVVATQNISGAGLCMFAAGNGKAAAEAKAQGKPPLPEIKWNKPHIHGQNNILTLVGAASSYGSGDGSVIVASCSEGYLFIGSINHIRQSTLPSLGSFGRADVLLFEIAGNLIWIFQGTDIKLWKADDGRCLGTVDTNQLKNTMATLSPDGRFLAAAAFTADVKVWELIYSKDGQVQTVERVMQLKGHKSAVTWLCFTWDSERIITASKDGTIRIWNINVRYHLDEDPKCLRVIPIPIQDSKGVVLYERLAVSPDGKVLAVSHGHLLQWLSTETGAVLDTAEHAHDGDILSLVWSPQPVPTERGKASILATASTDRKVKLWFPPTP